MALVLVMGGSCFAGKAVVEALAKWGVLLSCFDFDLGVKDCTTYLIAYLYIFFSHWPFFGLLPFSFAYVLAYSLSFLFTTLPTYKLPFLLVFFRTHILPCLLAYLLAYLLPMLLTDLLTYILSFFFASIPSCILTWSHLCLLMYFLPCLLCLQTCSLPCLLGYRLVYSVAY